MIALLRWALFGFIGLSIIYLVMSVYLRSTRREALEKRFAAGKGEGRRDEFITQGMRAYERGLQKRLLGLIYVVPAITFVVIVVVQNFW